MSGSNNKLWLQAGENSNPTGSQYGDLILNKDGTLKTVAEDGSVSEMVKQSTFTEEVASINTKLGKKADLDSNGLLVSSQLPSYVDDVLEYENKIGFPTTGESSKIYVDLSTNMTYRWSGSSYIIIGNDLALGETASTAYAGNKGAKNATDIAAIINGSKAVGDSTKLAGIAATEYLTKEEYESMQSDVDQVTISEEEPIGENAVLWYQLEDEDVYSGENGVATKTWVENEIFVASQELVPVTRTINGHELRSDLVLIPEDFGLSNERESIFIGTSEEYEALPDDQKAIIEMFVCTDGNEDGEVIQYALKETVDGILDGTYTVKNSEQLGGHPVEYFAVAGGSVAAVDSSTFVGTQAEFDALSEEEQNEVELFVCTDEGMEDEGLVYWTDLQVKEYEVVLSSSKWVDGKYLLEHDSIKENYKIEIVPGYNITPEELQALQGANIIEYQKKINGVGYLKAMGDVPAIDIPIRLVV